MYQKIYVPLDNSDHSNAAIAVAVRLAQATDAKLVGSRMEAIEGNARELGDSQVTTRVMDTVIQKWIEIGDFHEGRYGFKG